MSRGRKTKSLNSKLNWQEYFNKNVGIYLQSIIIELGHLHKCSNETGSELLKQIQKQRSDKKKINLLQIKTEEIPFEIPENWVWCRLGEIIEYTDNLNIETAFSKETLINYVDIDAIDNKNHKIRENKLKAVSELSSRARRVLKKGYILYSLVRPYLNNIAIIEEELANHIGSTGFAVFNGIKVNNKYLKYILLSDYVRQLYLSMLSGFNSPTITLEQFNSTPIPLPPTTEQNRILEFLSDFENERINPSKTYFNQNIEKKIFKLHKSQLLSVELFSELETQLTQVENLNQAILQEAVQGKLVEQDHKDEPASELLKRIKEEKAKLGKKEKPLPPIKPEEFPFEIPENWTWCRLGEITDFVSGHNFESGDFYKGDGIKCIKITNVGVREIIETEDVLPISFGEKFNQFLVYEGDLVLALTRPYISTGLKISICPPSYNKSLLNQRVAVIRNNKEISGNYVYQFLSSSIVLKKYKSMFEGQGQQPNLKKEDVTNLVFPLPPLSEQKRIVTEIEKQLAKIKKLKEHILANQLATEQLLKALLHQAFEVKQNN